MRSPLKFVLSAFAACATCATFAWTDTGHMVIAAIAKRDLRPSVLAEAERLLQIGGTGRTSDFITAACWADDVRSQRRETSTWHYMDFHFRKDGKPSELKADAENAAWAIDKFTKILGDQTKSDAERADALRFILHFVGDIHQPLHGTARDTDEFPKGDRGGNDFEILPPASMKDADRAPRNLHSLWDLGAGLFTSETRPLSATGQKRIDIEATTLVAALPRDTFRLLKRQNPVDWAKESFEASKKDVYSLEEKTSPSESYMMRARTVAAQRATLAGYRLADLLNRTLK